MNATTKELKTQVDNSTQTRLKFLILASLLKLYSLSLIQRQSNSLHFLTSIFTQMHTNFFMWLMVPVKMLMSSNSVSLVYSVMTSIQKPLIHSSASSVMPIWIYCKFTIPARNPHQTGAATGIHWQKLRPYLTMKSEMVKTCGSSLRIHPLMDTRCKWSWTWLRKHSLELLCWPSQQQV